MFLETLNFSSLYGFSSDYLLNLLPLLYKLLELRAVGETNLFSAFFNWTKEVSKRDPGRQPPVSDDSGNAVEVKHMLTSFKHNTRHVAQTAGTTNPTVFIFLNIFCELVVDQNAVLVQTRQTLFFSSKSLASVTTVFVDLFTTLLH